MTAIELIERAREACTPPTWYQLAKECSTKEGVVSWWRHHQGRFSDDAAYRISELLGMPFVEVIAIREASTERDEARRNRWLERLGKRVRTVSNSSALQLIFLLAFAGHWLTKPDHNLSATVNRTSLSDTVQIIRQALARIYAQCRAIAKHPAFIFRRWDLQH